MKPDFLPARLPFLATASSFFCFVRLWWGGNGFDAVVWHQCEREARFQIHRTGEVIERRDAKILTDKRILGAEYRAVISTIQATHALDEDRVIPGSFLTHYDVWIGFKRSDDDDAHWLKVPGGITRDPDVIVLYEFAASYAPRVVPTTRLA